MDNLAFEYPTGSLGIDVSSVDADRKGIEDEVQTSEGEGELHLRDDQGSGKSCDNSDTGHSART